MGPSRTTRCTASGRLIALTRLLAAAGALWMFACAPDGDELGEPARAERVWSGQAFEIEGADGSRSSVVLAGVRAPSGELHPAAAQAARNALTARLDAAGAQVEIQTGSDPGRDRYDRRIIAAQTPEGDLAESLVREGRLMVWPRAGETVDFARLYAAEVDAREAGAGAWGDGGFAVHDPDPNALSQRLDGPVIVEGRVVDTGEARDGRVFVNFGLDWRTDFTATADRRSRTVFEEAGMDLMTLEGTVVRVRGWLYETNGPSISLTHPAQLELVDAPEARRLR